MKKFIALLLAIMLGTAYPAMGQMTSITLQTAATSGNGATLTVSGQGLAMATIVGTAGADRVVTWQISQDGTNFAPIICVDTGAGTAESTTTASGTTPIIVSCPVGGARLFRAPVSGGATGSVTVTASALPGIQPSFISTGGGGGSGTVTATAGALTANRLILGNGGTDVKAAASLTGPIIGNGASAPTASAQLGVVNGGTAVATFTAGIITSPGGTAALTSVAAPTGAVVGTTDTQTLSAKRIPPRLVTVTPSATPTINTDNGDVFSITGLTVDITNMSTNLTGTPTASGNDFMMISITGTASRGITWGTSFESSTVTLPTTTSGTNRLDVMLEWNAATSKWRCIAVA
jgi:hypothetical protein